MLSNAAKALLKDMATSEYATLAVLPTLDARTGKYEHRTPEAVAELIRHHAIRFPDGENREDRLRCQITREGLKLYDSLRHSEPAAQSR